LQNTESGIGTVLENMQTIVSSEGGNLELISSDNTSIEVTYLKGINEECPECVPDHDMVKMMIESYLSIYAPYITSIRLT
jgi:Fe-S cluster biogenesis protein NfuA|tara:strand:+ start:298 stop:537 length:240 start_codon:yes stop_codon:yes gene_type:complete